LVKRKKRKYKGGEKIVIIHRIWLKEKKEEPQCQGENGVKIVENTE
jgi:hypothetical protein